MHVAQCWRVLNPKFQGEAQGPLGGGAGALLPSGCGMEEEAGEGDQKEKEKESKAVKSKVKPGRKQRK